MLTLIRKGWRRPIIVSKRSGFITSGHGRLLSAKLNGWGAVPVNFQDYDSDEQEYADVQADNAIAMQADLDIKQIKLDIKEMPNLEIRTLGIQNIERVEAHVRNTSQELSSSDFDEFDHKCPKCGFEFDDAKD